jgi:hypothetical protein
MTNRLSWHIPLLSIRSDSKKPNLATCRWRRQGAMTHKVDVRKSDLLNEKSPRNLFLRLAGWLLPVSVNPHPPAGTALPLAFNPDCRYSRTLNPSSGYPYVICSSPAPIPACPDIPWSGRNGLRFNLNGRRRSCHDYFSTDHSVSLRFDDFLPDFRGCRGHNGLTRTAAEYQRREPNKIKSSFHSILLSLIRFSMASRWRPIDLELRYWASPRTRSSPGGSGCKNLCRLGRRLYHFA